MSTLRRLFCVLLSAALLPAAAPAQQPADAAARVDAVFTRWASGASPGCAVAVARDGHTILERAYGMADLEHGVANSTSTIFEAGSVSKQFTAAAVVLLAGQGRLSLDDDVRTRVPELPDYGYRITIRHLLNHTSGLRDWGSVAAIAGWGRSARTHTHDHVLDILARQRALNFTPGAEYSYSNSGYNLLAVIVERVSGASLAEFSKQHIFEPLGLRDTQWRDDYTRIVPRRASAYGTRDDAFVIDRPIEDVYGNGGLLTTVADLLTWNAALAAGRLGSNALGEEMLRQGVLNDGSTIDYASGIVVTRYHDVPELSHTGATSGYRAFLARYPAQQLDVALLCNVGNANPGSLGHQVADVFLGDAVQRATAAGARPPAASAASATAAAAATAETAAAEADSARASRANRTRFEPPPAQLGEYAGEYYSPDAETTLRLSVDAASGALIAERRPATRMTLTPVEADLFESPLGRIRFIRDAQQKITQLSVQQARVYDLRFDRVR